MKLELSGSVSLGIVFYFILNFNLFFQFCDEVAIVATIHKRKKSQIWLQVREGNRHFLESCYVLAISKNPVFKYGDSHVFLFGMWRTKRNLKIAKKKKKKKRKEKKRKGKKRGLSCTCEISHKKNWLLGKGKLAMQQGISATAGRLWERGRRPDWKEQRPTYFRGKRPADRTRNNDGTGGRSAKSGSLWRERTRFCASCLLVSHVVSFTNCAINLDCHRLLVAFITSHKSLLLLRQLIILPTHQAFVSRRNLLSSIASQGSRFRRIRDEPEGGSSSHQVHRD